MNIEQLAKESYANDVNKKEFTFTLADPESCYNLGFSRGILAGMDYAASLIKLQQAPTLERQDIKIEENEKTLHY